MWKGQKMAGRTRKPSSSVLNENLKKASGELGEKKQDKPAVLQEREESKTAQADSMDTNNTMNAKTETADGTRITAKVPSSEPETEIVSVQDEDSSLPPEKRKPMPQTTRRPGRPRKETTITQGSRKGLQPGQERITVVAESALLDRLRDYAYTKRITLKASLDKAIREFIASEVARGVDIIKRPED